MSFWRITLKSNMMFLQNKFSFLRSWNQHNLFHNNAKRHNLYQVICNLELKLMLKIRQFSVDLASLEFHHAKQMYFRYNEVQLTEIC